MPFKLYRWDGIPEEQITPLLSRRVIWGKNQTIAFFHLKKGCHIGAHQHESEQFSYVLDGSLKFVLEGKHVIVSKGDCIHLSPNVVHEVDAIEDTHDIDIFSPVREDWLRNEIDYMRER